MAEPLIKVTVVNDTTYKLSHFKQTDSAWRTPPPAEIPPGATVNFSVNLGMGSVAYLASDTNDQVGFVTMTFERPSWWIQGASAAEGSVHREGLFLSAGLQPYERVRGQTLNVTYRVGDPNKACWAYGDRDNGKVECGETMLAPWARAMVCVNNTTNYMLELEKTWNDNWNTNELEVPSGGSKIMLLDDNDRGGLLFRAKDEMGREKGIVTMVVTCPSWTGVSAEGSSSAVEWCLNAGLQPYDRWEKPARLVYRVGEQNRASWTDGNSDDGKKVCQQTTLEGLTRVVVENNNDFDLSWSKEWHMFGDGDMWFYDPMGPVKAHSKRIFFIQLPGRAGLHFYGKNRPYHLSFSRSASKHNYAEGSKLCGLQRYSKTEDPPTFVYKVTTPNQASWFDAERDDGTHFIRQTNIMDGVFSKERLEEALLYCRLAVAAYKTENEIRQSFKEDFKGSFELVSFLEGKETDSQGYVAYNARDKIAVLGFRGTSSFADVLTDIQQRKVPYVLPGVEGDTAAKIRVVDGFRDAYVSIQDEVKQALDDLHERINFATLNKLYVTGHSLGGALAVMAGMQLAFGIKMGRYAPMKPEAVKVVAIAAPPTANGPLRSFILHHDETFDCNIYRMKMDSVSWGKWQAGPVAVDFRKWDYQHAGRVFVLDSEEPFPNAHYGATYLKKLKAMLDAGGEEF